MSTNTAICTADQSAARESPTVDRQLRLPFPKRDAVAATAVDVRAECKRRFGRACVLIYGPDMETVVQELDCRGNWCPALKRVIEESEDDYSSPQQ